MSKADLAGAALVAEIAVFPKYASPWYWEKKNKKM